MYNLPSNLKTSLHKTRQTLLLFLKPLQKQTLERKKWGDMAYYIRPPEKVGGTRPPCSPPNWAHVTNHDFGPDTNYTSTNCTDRPQVNIHCIEHFFIVHDFWATCACPEKTELPWNFLLYWIYFLHSGVLSNLHALALKNRGCPEFTVLNVYFLLFRIFEQLALALKNRVDLEFFTILKYILWFRIFEELTVALKTEFALKIFKPGGRPPPRLVRLCPRLMANLAQPFVIKLILHSCCIPFKFQECFSWQTKSHIYDWNNSIMQWLNIS